MDDHAWMGRTLALAAQGRGLTSPNPMVGALVVSDGAAVGEGVHRRAGEPHAEVEALRAAGPEARGASLYVNLEPCVHRGRTPPCVDALLEAGIRRVVVGCLDPNPVVNGRGVEALRQAGVEVTVGVREEEARVLNRAFFKFIATGRPLVTLKTAMTLDGKIAAWDGASRWITGEAARAEGHRMRAGADAILVGVGTVLRDDPELTVRLPELGPREPLRVVVDSRLRTPPEARLLKVGAPARTLIACVAGAPAEAARALSARGVEVLGCPARDGRVDLDALLADLARRGVVSLLAEGGGELHASLLEAGLVDRVAIFVAPLLLGGRHAPGPVGGSGRGLKEALRLGALEVRRIGRDLLIEADLERRDVSE